MCQWSFICAYFEILKHIKHWQKILVCIYLKGVYQKAFFLCQRGQGFHLSKNPTSLFFIPMIPAKYNGNFLFSCQCFTSGSTLGLECSLKLPLCVEVLISGTSYSLGITLLARDTKIVVLRFSTFVSFVTHFRLQFLQLQVSSFCILWACFSSMCLCWF